MTWISGLHYVPGVWAEKHDSDFPKNVSENNKKPDIF